MAKNPTQVMKYRAVSTTKRPGVHAKTKTSKNKRSKLYSKPNVGQG